MCNGTISCLMKKARVKKSRNTVPLNWASSPSPLPFVEACPVQLIKLKLCRISLYQKSRNSAEFDKFRNTEFRTIPPNFGPLRIVYRICEIEKKPYGIPYRRNSENTRGKIFRISKCFHSNAVEKFYSL